TSFAGSIGIIGIALILAISHGMTAYINAVQESTLSAYPLTLESSTVELTSLMNAFMNVDSEDENHDTDAVYIKDALYNMITAMNNIEETENDLKAFNEYILAKMKEEDSELAEAINGIQYSYDLDLRVYTENVDGKILHSNLENILTSLLIEYVGVDMSAMTALSPMGSMSSMSSMSPMGGTTLWQELLPGTDGAPINDLILDQYDVIYGSWPNDYNEVVLVVDRNNELDDVALYALGLLPQSHMDALADASINGAEIDRSDASWSYEDICNAEYRVILNADCYHYDEVNGTYTDLRASDTGLRYLYTNALPLKVTGIIRPAEDADTTMLTGTICYTSDLTKYVIEKSKDSDAIAAQLADPDTDVITGLPFDSTTGTLSDEEKETIFRDYVSDMTAAEKAAAFVSINSIPSKEFVQQQLDATLGSMTRKDIEELMLQGLNGQSGVSADELTGYLESMSDEEIYKLFTEMMTEQIKAQYAQQVAAQMASMTPEQLVMSLEMALPTYTTEQCAVYYDELIVFSDSTYEDNLLAMGYIDLETPATMNIYASSFENKDVITAAIDDYNSTVEELKMIKYTDYLGIMMSSITTIINAITYVLIAFVAISLIVSSIMIGVITLISVQERTKEIGILRAIGASKRDVSGMFNAETVIIGFTSGILGIAVTYLLCIPINMILHHLTGIANLNAVLPVPAAIILICISMLLTLISGIIPSRSAAKKDPVVALRTE
ncbi:MAG: ABC transporter permease, partial [Oscillospiraceae bacterium]|nr:ABC transporter permease [Oscillospiraceae bacterium]